MAKGGKRTPIDYQARATGGRRLRELRELRGLALEDVARRLRKRGVDLSWWTVRRWETGEALPPLEVFGALAPILDLSRGELAAFWGYAAEEDAALLAACRHLAAAIYAHPAELAAALKALPPDLVRAFGAVVMQERQIFTEEQEREASAAEILSPPLSPRLAVTPAGEAATEGGAPCVE